MSDLMQRLLAERSWLLADGATGTNLFAMGLQHGDAPELWNLQEPGKVSAHYRAFIEAGSDLVLTNSFGGTANRLKLHGAEEQVREINAAAARLLKQEIEASGREVVCAGSVGPTGDLFVPLGPLTHEEGVSVFRAQCEGLAEGGADVAWIETMSAPEEMAAALDGAAAAGLTAVCTVSFDTNGRTMMGVTPAQLPDLLRANAHPPLAFGGNCGTGAAELVAALLAMAEAAKPEDVLVAKANCGIPEFVDGEVCYNGTPELMAHYAVLARDAGARIIGGCCGTTPKHVMAMRRVLEETTRGERPGLAEIEASLGAISAGGRGEGPDPDSRRREGRRRRG